jgi:hypothetical protein
LKWCNNGGRNHFISAKLRYYVLRHHSSRLARKMSTLLGKQTLLSTDHPVAYQKSQLRKRAPKLQYLTNQGPDVQTPPRSQNLSPQQLLFE